MCFEKEVPQVDRRKVGPYIIAVDFDGVIHSYEKGWHDGTIYGTPAPGCKETMQKWMDAGYDLLIYSVRAFDRTQFGTFEPNQLQQMTEWLHRYNIPYTTIWNGYGKPFAHLYVDDNAYRHTCWNSTESHVRRFHGAWQNDILQEGSGEHADAQPQEASEVRS